jgi:predicted nucleic acid-binding Zn finger protein
MLMLVLTNFFEYLYVRDHSLFMAGGGLAKKGVGHEVFLTEKGGGDVKILVEKGRSSYFIIVGGNLTCNDYCYSRERARQQI